MTVLPNGEAKPVAENASHSVKIELKRMGEKWEYSDVCPKKYDYIEIQDSGGLFPTGHRNPCYQIVDFVRGLYQGLDKLPALQQLHACIALDAYRHIDLQIARDDLDWRFILSNTDLTTEKQARELRVRSPNSPFRVEAEANVYFITGECVLDQKPASE